MRLVRLLPLVALGVVLTACDPGIAITVENLSDTDVYLYMSGGYDNERATHRPDTTSIANKTPISPGETHRIVEACFSDTTLWVVLVAEGREVYGRSTTCGRWVHSGARVAVEGTGGTYSVSDNLGADPSRIHEDRVGPSVVGSLLFFALGLTLTGILVALTAAVVVGPPVAAFLIVRALYRRISRGHSGSS